MGPWGRYQPGGEGGTPVNDNSIVQLFQRGKGMEFNIRIRSVFRLQKDTFTSFRTMNSGRILSSKEICFHFYFCQPAGIFGVFDSYFVLMKHLLGMIDIYGKNLHHSFIFVNKERYIPFI